MYNSVIVQWAIMSISSNMIPNHFIWQMVNRPIFKIVFHVSSQSNKQTHGFFKINLRWKLRAYRQVASKSNMLNQFISKALKALALSLKSGGDIIFALCKLSKLEWSLVEKTLSLPFSFILGQFLSQGYCWKRCSMTLLIKDLIFTMIPVQSRYGTKEI